MRTFPIAVVVLALFAEVALPAQTEAQWSVQGKTLKAAGDAAGALDAFRKAAELNPKSAEFQDEIGFLLAVLSRHEEAIPHFELAIGLDPTTRVRTYSFSPRFMSCRSAEARSFLAARPA